jgi:3-oxosteroid 1-dehydrogenase
MSDFDETFDFVVVGCGGGSMVSALLMRSLSKSVVILEKTEYVGGTTARSGGVMWIPDNPFMKRDGVEDSFEKSMTYLQGLVEGDPDAPGATRERQAKYVTEAPRMIAFLVKQGMPFDRVRYWPDYYDDAPGGSVDGRTVVTQPFDLKKLGPWREKMQPGWLSMPLSMDEMLELPYFKRSWKGKKLVVKVAFQMALAKILGRDWSAAGVALQARMLQLALKAGVDIRTNSGVSELIEEDGVITGVVTVKDGKPWRVGAKLGVLVNAGGFARNQTMRDQYQPGTQAKWSNTTKGDTGEMIREMMRHGAAIAQMDAFVGYQTTEAPGSENDLISPMMQSTTAAPHAILVDQSGVRYMNEGGSYMAYCRGMLERNKTVGAVPSWAIFDAHVMKSYMLNGTMPGSKKPASWTDTGYMKQADTIEGLAALISVDPATLKNTVDRFNGFVDQNRDEDFGRGNRAYDNWLGDPTHGPSRTLGRIDQGPFYAIPVVPGDVGTYGGVVTDANARVLREDGSVITGLYATGISTASVMGRVYPGAGSSVGPSFTFGYVAAKHAAGADNLAV